MNGINFHDEMVYRMGNTNEVSGTYAEYTRTYAQSYNDWLDKHDEEIQADAIKKFTEWMQENNYHIFTYFMSIDDGVDTKTISFDEVLAEYGKEQKE